jgi:hypothetical protein
MLGWTVAFLFDQEANIAAMDFGLKGFPRSFRNPRAASSADNGSAKASLYAEVTPRRDHTGGKQ